jgi:hypothetical protein
LRHAGNHLDANGSEERPEVAAAELKPYIGLMRRFGITPLTPVAMTLYEEALAERNIEPLG